MTAPRTRIDAGATEFERELLGAWEHEGPSRRVRDRAFGIIGAGAGLGATSATGAAGAVGGAIARVAAPKAMASSALAVAKWFAVGSVVVAGAVSVAPFVSRSKEAAPRATTAPNAPSNTSVAENHDALPRGPTSGVATDATERPPPAASSAALPANAAEHVDGPTPKIESSAPPRAVSAAPARVAVAATSTAETPAASARAASNATPPPESTEKHGTRALGDQVASVDRARAALAAGNVTDALRELDAYDSRFPMGALSQEVIVLRVEALVKEGNRSAARALGDRFLSRHPASPYAAKIRQLLD